jgi:magnesium transporter
LRGKKTGFEGKITYSECDSTTLSVPMARPTLPRIRRGRTPGTSGDVAERVEPRISELSANGLTWIHVDQPGPLEAALLADRFGFHELDVEDILSKRQRPKIDEYESYLFIVLHFPFYDKTVQRLNAAELDMFIGPDFLITLPNVELLPVTYLFRRCEEDPERRDELFSKGSGYLLYHVLDDLFDYCFPILDKIGWKLDAIEDDLFEGRSDDVVRDISDAKQEIIAYRKIIKPERATLRVLERYTQRFLPAEPELEFYFDDIVDASERIWDLLDNYKEVIEGLESTNESIISHRQQYRLQILTVVSVILLPLTLLASIFGMNVQFPGFGTREAFWVLLGIIVGVGGFLLGVFRWRRWL